jgi:very-short-patch-repair endonuclease
MLTKKYLEEFLKLYDEENNKGKIIENIIETEEETKVELLDWEDDEIAITLKKAGSVSPQSLNRNMVILRKFADFICKKEKLPKRKYEMEDGVFMKLIDKDQLLASTISYDQYLTIREGLDMSEGGERINIRDKVIFELAWEGLTNDEIRSIKEENIEFVISESGWEATIISLENKTIRIEDTQVTEDIKLCLKETYCVRTAKDLRTKKTFYKDSKYLIKPINVGRTSDKTYLDNPHLALQRVFRTGEIVCSGIEVENLTLADVRRSKLIYLLAPENEEFFDFETVAAIYGLKRPQALRWYKKIADEKYKI